MPKPTYPPDHVPAMRVPKGGSSCASCEYVSEDKKHCSNEDFIAWHGSNKLPAPADAYCSDWYEPRTLDTSRSPHGFASLRSLRSQAGAEAKEDDA